MVVTGTRKGIGNYLAKYYLDRGYRVFGCSRENVKLDSPAYQHFCMDVADETSVRNLFSVVREK